MYHIVKSRFSLLFFFLFFFFSLWLFIRRWIREEIPDASFLATTPNVSRALFRQEEEEEEEEEKNSRASFSLNLGDCPKEGGWHSIPQLMAAQFELQRKKRRKEKNADCNWRARATFPVSTHSGHRTVPGLSSRPPLQPIDYYVRDGNVDQ